MYCTKLFQREIHLTLPNDLKTSDLKWLSVWCRAFRVDFGHVMFPDKKNPTPNSYYGRNLSPESPNNSTDNNNNNNNNNNNTTNSDNNNNNNATTNNPNNNNNNPNNNPNNNTLLKDRASLRKYHSEMAGVADRAWQHLKDAAADKSGGTRTNGAHSALLLLLLSHIVVLAVANITGAITN